MYLVYICQSHFTKQPSEFITTLPKRHRYHQIKINDFPKVYKPVTILNAQAGSFSLDHKFIFSQEP